MSLLIIIEIELLKRGASIIFKYNINVSVLFLNKKALFYFNNRIKSF